ncbi:hypothetical protein TNCV_1366941 [Trichonephila clavipes]|nr:hypothetical protein TNCV_1366941 [Trichonephila clavipes]
MRKRQQLNLYSFFIRWNIYTTGGCENKKSLKKAYENPGYLDLTFFQPSYPGGTVQFPSGYHFRQVMSFITRRKWERILYFKKSWHEAAVEGNILQSPALVVSAATAHKTFGPTDLRSTYSVCTRRVFGGIRHRTQAFRSGIRCSNH